MKFSHCAGAAFGALVVLSAACADPTEPHQIITAAHPISIPNFPSLSKSGAIYNEGTTLYKGYWANNGGFLVSRYVLYDDGTFALQFMSALNPFFEYVGTYTRTATQITFDWGVLTFNGPWGASAILDGNSMNVTYNDIMSLGDFLDGLYVKPATSP